MSDQNPPISNLKLITFAALSGQTLEQVLQRDPPPWPVERVVALLQSIAVVISGLHAQGGAHGALNPRNVRFDSSGRVMLDNFSRFQATEEEPVPPDRLTALYLTPEQSFGDKPNAQSDIYSLGALAFELLTGRPLFDGENPEEIVYKHRTASVPNASEVRPGLNPEIDKVVARALNRDPRNRFHLVKHFVDGLKRTLPPANPEAAPPAAPPISEPAAPQLQPDEQRSFAQTDAGLTVASTRSPIVMPPAVLQTALQQDDEAQLDEAQLDEPISASARPPQQQQDDDGSVPTARPQQQQDDDGSLAPDRPPQQQDDESQQDDDISVATTSPLLNLGQPTLAAQAAPTAPQQQDDESQQDDDISVATTRPLLNLGQPTLAAQAAPVAPPPPAASPPPPVAAPPAQPAKIDLPSPPAPAAPRSAASLKPPLVAAEKSAGTEIWTKPAAPPPPEPPRKRSFVGAIVAIGVVVAMVVALRMQPETTVAKSNPDEIKRLRHDYLEAKPPRLLPMPDEARKTGMLKQVLMTDYMSLLIEQYKAMYLNLFNELDSAKKKADAARVRAEQLEKEVKAGRQDLTAKLNAAQAEAVRARQEVAAAKQSVDATNSKLSYFQGQYSGLKKQVDSGNTNALMPK